MLYIVNTKTKAVQVFPDDMEIEHIPQHVLDSQHVYVIQGRMIELEPTIGLHSVLGQRVILTELPGETITPEEFHEGGWNNLDFDIEERSQITFDGRFPFVHFGRTEVFLPKNHFARLNFTIPLELKLYNPTIIAVKPEGVDPRTPPNDEEHEPDPIILDSLTGL